MRLRVGITNVINEIKATYHIPLSTLINKQKHSSTDTKTTKHGAHSHKRGRPPKNEKVNPCSDKYFEADDKKLGEAPVKLLQMYTEALDEFRVHKLIPDNKLFMLQLDPNQNPLCKVLMNLVDKDVEGVTGKDQFENCDFAFAVYLKHCSTKTNDEFFKTICKFVILYREVFNQYGPDKYVSDDSKQQWEKEFFHTLHRRYYEKAFSELVGTEFLPDVSNELYVFFQFHYSKLDISKELVKELTLNFTSWLHKRGLTTAKVML